MEKIETMYLHTLGKACELQLPQNIAYVVSNYKKLLLDGILIMKTFVGIEQHIIEDVEEKFANHETLFLTLLNILNWMVVLMILEVMVLIILVLFTNIID